MIKREGILDIISLNQFVRNGKSDNTVNYQNYQETVKPKIKEFKAKYGATPNLYLKNALRPFFSKLSKPYALQDYSHYGNNSLNDLVWACIHYRFPKVPSLYASFSPQIYVLVNAEGIKIGFDYGSQVKKESDLVRGVLDSEQILKKILSSTQYIEPYSLEKGSSKLGNDSELLAFNNIGDVKSSWDNTVHLIKQFYTNDIPEDIGEVIHQTLSELFEVFQLVCQLETNEKYVNESNEILHESEIEYSENKNFHQIILRQLIDYRKKNPDFNFLTRQRTGAGKRFESGYCFQGNDKYAFVGIINASGGSNRTRSVGIVFTPDENTFNVWFEVVFKGVKDQILIDCYQKVVSLFDNVKELSSEKYKIEIGKIPKNDFKVVFKFIEKYYEKIRQIFKSAGREDVLVSEEKFNELIQRLRQYQSIQTKATAVIKEVKEALNMILYGPPGTGKTYLTKELAVQIASPFFSIDKDMDDYHRRKVILKEYDRLYKTGQIVFTTFHQSYSYEDFVEGIKPETTDNQVTYSIVPGIFKEICEKADTKDASNFEEALTQFKSDVEVKEKITINTGSIEFDVFYRGGKTFKINPKDSKVENPQYPASIENILKLYKNSPNENMYNPSYVRGILNHLYSEYGLKKYDSINSENENNYVLIIDEINRGNVSAIFGELITLLEPDKRLGASEEVVLKLPYSKDETFGIPPNLYIIGTMNTADRSVEALDTALRRRFIFREVMPKPKLLEEIAFDGFNLKEVLKTINERIEALLDRDHMIGHSYFITLENGDKKGLSNTFQNNIIPLLQEYFYNDYEKIALVLGKGFVKEKNQKPVEFAEYDNVDIPETDRTYELIPEVKDIEKAVKLLLNISNEQ